MILLYLNFDPNNNIVEILFTRAFLVDCFIWINIVMIVLKESTYSLPGSVLIILETRSCSIGFYLVVSLFCSQYFCRCVYFHQFVSWTYSHEKISESCNLNYYIVFAYFILQAKTLLLLALILLLLGWHHIV